MPGDIEQLASELNDRFQGEASPLAALDMLLASGPQVLIKVSDLNHVGMDYSSPRKATLAFALVNDKFGLDVHKRDELL